MCRDATCVSNGYLWNPVSGDDVFDYMDVCLERVLVHFGANHMALWKIGPAHPNQSRSHCLALATRARTDTHTQDIETEPHLYGQLLVWERCDATDVCLVRALVLCQNMICNEKYLKPQRPRHILKIQPARLGDQKQRLHGDQHLMMCILAADVYFLKTASTLR